jgi:hypothetical protein
MMSERLKVSILAISERENLDPAKLSTKDFVEEKYLQRRRNPLFQESHHLRSSRSCIFEDW